MAHLTYDTYGSKCAVCGWQASTELIRVKNKLQHAHGNEIHHIKAVCDGGGEEADNLILLCPNHHKQAGMGVLSEEELK